MPDASTDAPAPANAPGGARIIVLGMLMRATGITLAGLAVVIGVVVLIQAPPFAVETPAYVPLMAALFAIRSAVHAYTGHRLMLGGRAAVGAMATYRVVAVGQTALVVIGDSLTREPPPVELGVLAAFLLAWPLLATLLVSRAMAAGAARTDHGLPILGAVVWFAAALGVFGCVVALGIAALGGGMGFGWYAVALVASALILGVRFRRGITVGGHGMDGAYLATCADAVGAYRTVSWVTLAAVGGVALLTLALTAGWSGVGWWALGAGVALAMQSWVGSLGVHAQAHLEAVEPAAWTADGRAPLDLAGVGAVLAAFGALSIAASLDELVVLAQLIGAISLGELRFLLGALVELLDGPLLLAAGWRLWRGRGRRLALVYGLAGVAVAVWGLVNILGAWSDMPSGMPGPGAEFILVGVLASALPLALPATVLAVLWRERQRP